MDAKKELDNFVDKAVALFKEGLGLELGKKIGMTQVYDADGKMTVRLGATVWVAVQSGSLVERKRWTFSVARFGAAPAAGRIVTGVIRWRVRIWLRTRSAPARVVMVSTSGSPARRCT